MYMMLLWIVTVNQSTARLQAWLDSIKLQSNQHNPVSIHHLTHIVTSNTEIYTLRIFQNIWLNAQLPTNEFNLVERERISTSELFGMIRNFSENTFRNWTFPNNSEQFRSRNCVLSRHKNRRKLGTDCNATPDLDTSTKKNSWMSENPNRTELQHSAKSGQRLDTRSKSELKFVLIWTLVLWGTSRA